MKRSEWAKEIAKLQARWPRQPVSPESAAIWFEDLAEFPAEQVNAAIVALYRSGREWAPNGAQIRLKVLELDTPARDWGKAYELAMKAAGPGGGAATGLSWLEERDPLAADAARRYGWDDFCLGETADSTRRAQFRDIFREISESADRHDRYRGIEPAGLKVLEEANRPKRFGDVIQLGGRVQIPELSAEGKKAVRDAGGDPDRVRQIAQGVADGRLDPFEEVPEDAA